MEMLPKNPAADSTRHKALAPSAAAAAPGRTAWDSLSLPSYEAYPAHRPFVNTHHTLQTRTRGSYRPALPSRAFPESSSAAILSALRNLQEKITKLEFQKEQAERGLCALGKGAGRERPQRDGAAQRLANDKDTKREQPNCNQVLVTHLAAAESRCEKLERQLEQMRRTLRSTRTGKAGLLNQQASMEKVGVSDPQPDAASERAQLEKLQKLEQEYLRLTHTQRNAEMKICELERKLEEEEHQRRLIQDKANQLQTGLEANRILLQSVSPRLFISETKEKKSSSKMSSSQHTEPHYRLSLKDVPFVTGTSVAGSHSVRANVQAVLSLLKRHQPRLCNRDVLSRHADRSEVGSRSDLSSASSSSGGEELSELLQALQEELRFMSLEQGELVRQVEESVSEEERKALQREQERLLRRMKRKGEQINKLCNYKSQIKKLRKEARSRKSSRTAERPATRGRSPASTKAQPGERSKRNLRLLKDMKALQASLWT
ncbi:centrosomal protein of 57 kDa isoform X2 [Fundulus heteroclitus]|uniref:centrosomal protein of 57 kDa isoform X2 n=1 Tax=Fundulus heteroclitus TaxID=8078 RepID=UPI00165C574E|nr:centrosomal protein of 57 kDa isoform X2 [Fundulus heteroclitus]